MLLYHLDKLNIKFLTKRARNFFLILESSSPSINKKTCYGQFACIFLFPSYIPYYGRNVFALEIVGEYLHVFRPYAQDEIWSRV